MSTTMVKDPEVRPGPRSTGTRMVLVRANLMPEAILVARRTEVLRRRVMIALFALVGLLIAAYAVSWWGTHSSNSALDDANQRHAALLVQQKQYDKLVQAQDAQTTIDGQLHHLMGADVPWAPLLAELRSTAPAGVTLTSVTAISNAGNAIASNNAPVAGGAAPPDLSGTQLASVGQLSLNGSAPDQRSIAAYVDRLGRVKGLAAPTLTTFSGVKGAISFTVTVTLTTDARSGRYVTKSGGK